MDVRKVLALRGRNVWSGAPTLEAWVELGADRPVPPGFGERLRGGLPALDRTPGESLAHALAAVAAHLQRLAGGPADFADARETSQAGVHRVVFGHGCEGLARAAFDAAVRVCGAAERAEPFDADAEVAGLRDVAARLRPAPLAAALAEAAARRDVPVRELAPGLTLLGQGALQHRVMGARTDRTGAVAETIAADADLTRDLLGAVGLPLASADCALPRWSLLVVSGRLVAPAAHPEVAAVALEAAQVVGLDVASVVVAAPDLASPLSAGSGVVRVEAAPAVPAEHAAAAAEAIVSGLFPHGQTGRVPVVAVTGVNGKTTTARLIAHVLTRSRKRVGFTCTEGIYVRGRLIESGDCSGPRSAQVVLQHPEVDAAVLETARGGILRAGLGFDGCDVAVVTNVGEGDHLGSSDVETVEQLARVKRTLVEAVRPGGAAVLNADDPLVAAMAGHCPGAVVFFARSPSNPLLVAHRARGGRAAFVRDGRVVLAEGGAETPLATLAKVPLTGGGRIGFQIENVLAAVAAAWQLGVDPRVVRAALRTFGSDVDHVPARFNLLEVNGAVAVLDYGHNTSSLAAILETLGQFPPAYRTAVYSAAGDRRDRDLIRQGELLGDSFDRVILYEDGHCTRGRKPGEIIGLFKKGLQGRLRVDEIQEVTGAVRAVSLALGSARPGGLLLVQVDVVDETMDLVRGYLRQAAAREIKLEAALGLMAKARREQSLQQAVAQVAQATAEVVV